MPDVNSVTDEQVEAQRRRVEELRTESLVAQQAATVTADADNARTLEALKEEENRLLQQKAQAEAANTVAPEGGWPKPEDDSNGEYVKPMGTLEEPSEEATPTYVPGPGEELAGSPVTPTEPVTTGIATSTPTPVTPTPTPVTPTPDTGFTDESKES